MSEKYSALSLRASRAEHSTSLTVLHNGHPGSRFDAGAGAASAAAAALYPLMGRLSSLQPRAASVAVAVYTVAISVHENAISRKTNGTLSE